MIGWHPITNVTLCPLNDSHSHVALVPRPGTVGDVGWLNKPHKHFVGPGGCREA